MYATIDRYASTTGSVDILAEAGHRLGTQLSRASGFVAAVSVLAGPDELLTIRLFQDEPSLEAARQVVAHWAAEHRPVVGNCSTELGSGEVVAQKGL